MNQSTPEAALRIRPRIVQAFGFLKTIRGVATTLLSLGAILGSLFVLLAGPKLGGLYHVDENNGWMYAGSSYFATALNRRQTNSIKLTAKELKNGAIKFESNRYVVATSTVNLRVRPMGGTAVGILKRIGLAPPVVSVVKPKECLRINEVTVTGFQSIWIHITRADKGLCHDTGKAKTPTP